MEKKWPRRPAVARGIERGESSGTTARCRGPSWRVAFPSPLGRREKVNEKIKWQRRPAVAQGIERGELSGASRGSPAASSLPPALSAHTTARCRGPSWRDAFLRPSAREKSGNVKVATASRRGAGNRARGIERRHGKMPWPLCSSAACRLPPAAHRAAAPSSSASPRFNRRRGTRNSRPARGARGGIFPLRSDAGGGSCWRSPRGLQGCRERPIPARRRRRRRRAARRGR
jgi:hypothetical protein